MDEIEPCEDYDEVVGPLYGWRVYRVVNLNDGRTCLVPLYWPLRVADTGKPCYVQAGIDPDEDPDVEWAVVDLLEWTTADHAPKIYSFDEEVDTHGIHVFADKLDAHKYLNAYLGQACNYENNPHREVILAKVEIQGYVVEHEVGYRAEKARIVELNYGGSDKVREQLADALGWPFPIDSAPGLPSGSVMVKGSPLVSITADVSRFTIQLAEAGERARFLTKVMRGLEEGYPYRQSFQRALRYEDPTLAIHHTFLAALAQRYDEVGGTGIDFGMYDRHLLVEEWRNGRLGHLPSSTPYGYYESSWERRVETLHLLTTESIFDLYHQFLHNHAPGMVTMVKIDGFRNFDDDNKIKLIDRLGWKAARDIYDLSATGADLSVPKLSYELDDDLDAMLNPEEAHRTSFRLTPSEDPAAELRRLLLHIHDSTQNSATSRSLPMHVACKIF